MIVDDHAIIRRMVREVFEAEDLKVFDAANGAEGPQKAQEVKKPPEISGVVRFCDWIEITRRPLLRRQQ